MQAKIRAVSKYSFFLVDRFIDLHETNTLDTPEQVVQKYLKILDVPQEFPKVVISAREILQFFNLHYSKIKKCNYLI